MGCTGNKQAQNFQSQPNISSNSVANKNQKLKYNWTCPNCMTQFSCGSFMSDLKNHIKTCITYADINPVQNKTKDVVTKKPQDSRTKNQNKQQNGAQRQSYIFQKNLQDKDGLRYSWAKVKQSQKKPVITSKSSKQDVKNSDFQSKQKWFRTQVEKLRIGWQHGCSWVNIDQKDILNSSINQFKIIDLHKQIKIKFSSQRANDAGGLLRQWVHLVIKQIFSPQLGFFTRAETDQLTYKIRPCQYFDLPFGKKIAYLYGQIVGKAIFQKIPISTYMDRTIIRQLCNQQIQISDVFSYDKEYYLSWSYILNNNIESTQGVQFYHTINLTDEKTGKPYDHELIGNGGNVLVTQANKKQFIKKCINYMCHERIKYFISQIKSGLYTVIPKNLLQIFQPHQLQMVIYGVPFIDIEDWQTNTEYLGAYHQKHKTIYWFWEFLMTQQQQKLSKLLHFCTGTTRVPINGFKKLQTNRGGYSKFVIKSLEYNERDPYPKGHTCFNRLQLPVYPSKKLLQKYMTFILQADLQGIYGLD